MMRYGVEYTVDVTVEIGRDHRRSFTMLTDFTVVETSHGYRLLVTRHDGTFETHHVPSNTIIQEHYKKVGAS